MASWGHGSAGERRSSIGQDLFLGSDTQPGQLARTPGTKTSQPRAQQPTPMWGVRRRGTPGPSSRNERTRWCGEGVAPLAQEIADSLDVPPMHLDPLLTALGTEGLVAPVAALCS